MQWSKPGFPGGSGGANSKGWDAYLLFGQFFPENCMKSERNSAERGVARPLQALRPPMGWKGMNLEGDEFHYKYK